MKFLNVWDYFECSDTNISKKRKIPRIHSFLSKEAKTQIIECVKKFPAH